jgi:hypothetical protein
MLCIIRGLSFEAAKRNKTFSRVVVNVIPISELPHGREFNRRVRMLLRRSRGVQLVWDFERDSAGRCVLLVWQLPSRLRLTPRVLSGIRSLLQPQFVISDIDVFCVGETTLFDEDEDDSAFDARDHGSSAHFDADRFYSQI